MDFEGEPVFAELAILRILQSDGRDGVWVDSFRPRFCVGIGKYQTLPSEREGLLKQIYTAAGKSGGCFDVYAWKEDHVIFAESKRKSHDRIRQSQIRWLSAVLQVGVRLDSFLIVEWSMGGKHA